MDIVTVIAGKDNKLIEMFPVIKDIEYAKVADSIFALHTKLKANILKIRFNMSDLTIVMTSNYKKCKFKSIISIADPTCVEQIRSAILDRLA